MQPDRTQAMRRDDAREGPREIPGLDRAASASRENQVLDGPLMRGGAEDLQLGVLE
jgi:hypothetical protein